MMYCCKTACMDAVHGVRARHACRQRYRSDVLARACASTTYRHLTMCIQTRKHVSLMISQTHSMGINMHASRQCSHARNRTIRRAFDGQN
eukprot:2402286-Pleurochrysis_carterae.AAC.1